MVSHNMMRLVLSVGVLVFCGLTAAADGPREVRVIELEHMSANQARELINVYVGNEVETINWFEAGTKGVLRVSGTQSGLARCEEMLAEYDVPPVTVELHIHIIHGGEEKPVGNPEPASGPVAEALGGWNTPAVLSRLDSIVLSVPVSPTRRDSSSGEASAALPGGRVIGEEVYDIFASLRIDRLNLSRGKDELVSGRFQGTLMWPYQTKRLVDGTAVAVTEYRDLGIDTEFSMPAGAFRPVGKIVLAPGENLYFVLEARLAE